MNYSTNPFIDKGQVLLFKNWIKRRFINECDLNELPALVALAWCEAMREMSNLIRHEIVPFSRGKHNEL
jgi:formylmethanofuran dehydrogenase subunit A